MGVDISRELLLKAKEQASRENVFVLQADADHLPFREWFFEVVFAFTVLQNMPKPPETLVEFKRVAKLGGCVVVTGLKKAFSPAPSKMSLQAQVCVWLLLWTGKI